MPIVNENTLESSVPTLLQELGYETGYAFDKGKAATELVLEQAEVLCGAWG